MKLSGLIRREVALLTNNSGGDLLKGDVVIVDSTLELAFTTTTTAAYADGKVGVLEDDIPDGELGMVVFSGEVSQINLSASASLGDKVSTHTVAGQAARHASPRVEGDFAEVLDTGTNPPALLWGMPTPELGSVLNDYILIEDQKSSGTNGGSSTAGSWQTRDLNTEVHDSGGHASISGNQITLQAGTYRFCISAPAYQPDEHQIKLYNVTDAADVKLGTPEFNDQAAADAQTRSWVKGQFTIASAKVFEVRHQVAVSQTTNGYGRPASFGVETYTQAEFWKVA